jgi:hypothetical protein
VDFILYPSAIILSSADGCATQASEVTLGFHQTESGLTAPRSGDICLGQKKRLIKFSII